MHPICTGVRYRLIYKMISKSRMVAYVELSRARNYRDGSERHHTCIRRVGGWVGLNTVLRMRT